MPIYEYQCPDCGHRFDRIQKFSDPPVSVCPSCQAGHVKKLISAASFVLKGSGWYRDHYGLKSGEGGGEGRSSEAKASEGGKAEGGGADAAKSEGSKGTGAKGESGKGDAGKGPSGAKDAPSAAAPKADTPKPSASS